MNWCWLWGEVDLRMQMKQVEVRLNEATSEQRVLQRLSRFALDGCLSVVQRSLIINIFFTYRVTQRVGTVRGRTWIIGGVVDEFDPLFFETFVEPVCAELENVSWSFTVDGTVEFVEEVGVFRGETGLRGRCRCRCWRGRHCYPGSNTPAVRREIRLIGNTRKTRGRGTLCGEWIDWRIEQGRSGEKWLMGC